MENQKDQQFMAQALALAQKAYDHNEVPVGAVLVYENQIIGQGWNQPITLNDPSAHAEIIAIRDAAAHLSNYRLPGATLYVTLEPCTMCVGAMIHARIKRLVFGTYDPKSGMVKTVDQMLERVKFNHQIQWVGGCLAEECGKLLKDFFRERR